MQDKSKKTIPRLITGKLLKNLRKVKIREIATVKKKTQDLQKSNIKQKVNFSTETMETRRQQNDIFKVLKTNLEFYTVKTFF